MNKEAGKHFTLTLYNVKIFLCEKSLMDERKEFKR